MIPSEIFKDLEIINGQIDLINASIRKAFKLDKHEDLPEHDCDPESEDCGKDNDYSS